MILVPIFMSDVGKEKCTVTLAFVSQDDGLLVSGFHHHGNANSTVICSMVMLLVVFIKNTLKKTFPKPSIHPFQIRIY